MAWWKVDKCPTVTGFILETASEEFPTIESISPSNLQERSSILAKLSWERAKNGFRAKVAKCQLVLHKGSRLSISLRLGLPNPFLLGPEDGARPKTPHTWLQSQCCEWRIEWSTCSHYKIKVSSYIIPSWGADMVGILKFIESG
jgi:hypothetical protein